MSYMGSCSVCRTVLHDPEDYTATYRRSSNLIGAQNLRAIQEKARSLSTRQAMVYCPVCKKVQVFKIGSAGCCG